MKHSGGRSVLSTYSLVFVSVGAALVLTIVLLHFDSPLPFTAFALSAIAVTFWCGGIRPGILAVLVSALTRSYFFQPESSAVSRMLYSSVFLAFALVMILVTQARGELEAKVAERTAELTRANEELQLEIAERKRAEDRVRLALDTAPALIHTERPDGYLDFLSQDCLNYVGRPFADIAGWKWTAVIHPEDVEGMVAKRRASLASGEPFEAEARVRRADGVYRWMLHRKVPLRDEHGNIVEWYGSSIDIEDRKQAEEALRSSEREQRHIAAQLERERARLVEAQEVANVGSWEVELPTLNVLWSEQTHRIFETDLSCFEPTRPKFREFIHPEDRAKVDTAFAESLDKRSPCTVEYRIVMPDGRVKILEERWQAFHDEEGKQVRLAGTCRDITERVRAEEQLRRLSGELLRLQDEERRRIARDLHDSTGQNLVALATMLGQLRGSIPSGEQKASRLLSESRALADQCIAEIRTLSYVLHPPVLDDAGIEDAIRDYAKGFSQRSGVQVQLELSARLGRMPHDVELALFRVLQESLTNVQRHSGSLQAKIRLGRNGDNVVLEIGDSGRRAPEAVEGLDKEIPFKLGVGITSMQERAKLVGGRLEIDQRQGGTTVRVVIPTGSVRYEEASNSNR